MNKNIDKEKVVEIVRGTYIEFRKKEKNGLTKQTTVAEIIKLIERTLKDGD